MDLARFTLDALCDDASARTAGLTDFGTDADGWRDALRVLIESTAAEARLRDPEDFRELVLHHLGNRLRIQRCRAAAPEIGDLVAPRPVFVSGLPRAGTTTFSRLLAEDPRLRTPQLWELQSPAPTDLAHPWALTEDRIAAAERLVLDRARRGTLGIRPISIFLADECFYLMRNSFDSDHLHRAHARRPTYFRWLGARDRAGVYAYYRAQLQLLLWQRPCPPGGRLVVKNPFVHLENMATIFALFPDATLFNLTRDVASVMRSLCFKNRADRQAHSDHVTPEQVGQDMVENLATYYDRRDRELARLTPAQRGRVWTLPYDAWTGDPVAVMRDVYAVLAEPFPDALARRMTGALAQHARYGEAARYDLAEFGLAEAELRARFEPREHAFAARTATLRTAVAA